MVSKLRRLVLLSVAGVAIIAYASMLVAGVIEQRNMHERMVQAEIDKVASQTLTYDYVWGRLVEKHGSQDAALDALRDWAESFVEFQQAENRWRHGKGIKPENPSPLLVMSDDDASGFSKRNLALPYGCAKVNVFGSQHVWWNGH